MPNRPSTRFSAARGRKRAGCGLELLERRDCPATLSIVGTQQVGEAGGTATLRVELSEAVTVPVSVDYFLQGNATFGRDYRLADGGRQLPSPSGTLEFRAGETTKRISVSILNDTLREATEQLTVALFRPRNATLGSATSAGVTIVDDDSYTASIATRAGVGGATRLPEGTAGEFVLRLSAPATRPETFSINTLRTGTATAGADYRGLTNLPLVFAVGETQKAFRIQTLADGNAAEPDEFFFIEATPATAGFPAVDPFGVTIAGAGPAAVPQLSISDASVVEGNAGTKSLSFAVSLSALCGTPVTVSWSTSDGSATVADNDYAGVTGRSITIAPGRTTATVDVTLVGDTRIEADETFAVVLASPVGATILDGSGTGGILNDDLDTATTYQISLVYDNPRLPAAQRSVFEGAVRRLQSIVIGDLPDVRAGGRTIDDMEIRVFVEDMSPALNGYAMATAWRPGATGLPYQGEIHINSARIGNPGISYTVIHEMLHALGFAPDVFSRTATVSGLGTATPLFTGANATREYVAAFGLATAAGVPLYDDLAAEGTYAAHWSTAIGNEIMSAGWDTASTALRPFSRITVGALQDIGYSVNYAMADPYTRPAATPPGVTPPAVTPPADRGPTAPIAGGWFGDRDTRSLARAVAPALAGSPGDQPPTSGRSRAFAGLGRA